VLMCSGVQVLVCLCVQVLVCLCVQVLNPGRGFLKSQKDSSVKKNKGPEITG
jgi:hypothetical protein